MKKLVLPIIALIFVTLIIASSNTYDQISPSDTIQESQIIISEDGVYINIENATWVSYSNTNSMDPVLDSTANGIEIPVTASTTLEVGDIVSYEAKWNQTLVSHRIVEISEDEEGVYYILKGDNNSTQDSNKVRFEQIKYKLIAIIY